MAHKAQTTPYAAVDVHSITKSGSTTGIPSAGTTEECPICQGNITDLVITKCRHNYCRGCLEKSLQISPYCPVCKVLLRQVTGDQPDGGRMTHLILKNQHLPGYENFATIKITYFIPNGIQGPSHPHPGQQFASDTRHAYLPDSPEGREVCRLLKKAFDAKMIFTVGTSATTGKTNKIIWNYIHHKTSMHGGSNGYGYPDPTYLKKVKELHQIGIW
ncbi:probable E3 ubiquitin-protein ligase DTX3 [Dysidea avara]|uniref:probable E3 ubiquitin-protein ligase DTX3 n=1 Tax=Dysidea avara TaxID=196820 RepID=UPI003324EDBE